MSKARERNASKLKVAVVWTLTVILALLMALVGSGKFTNIEAWTQIATRLDVPYWLMQVAGVMEMLGVVLLLIPRVAALGGVAVVMSGAALAHVIGGEAQGAIAPLVYMAVALYIALQRADQLPWRDRGLQG